MRQAARASATREGWSSPSRLAPWLAGPLLSVFLLLLQACVGGKPPALAPPPPESALAAGIRRERAYLVSPLEGLPQAIDSGRRERIERSFHALVDSGSIATAKDTAAELLEVAPNFVPAQVLAAQVDFVSGSYRPVVDRLLPVGDAMPTYTASQLLLGRAAELLGDVPLAYAAYRAIAARHPKAFERTGELHSRALEEVSRRLGEALRGERLDEAGRDLTLLEAWGPTEPVTLRAARSLAVARGDRKAELAAIKGLLASAGRRGEDRDLLERRAELEVEVGDAGAGLKIFQDLVDHHPEDARLAERLAAAKFRWRLTLLPQEVREVAAKPELTKADLAVLIYWLVPAVRYAHTAAGRIATDVLDHPHREEIVRVVNLGLLDVDPVLHRFAPGAQVRRGAALRSLGRLLLSLGQKRDVSCAREDGSALGTCDMALRCGLIDGEDSCEAGAALSGSDAVELLRRGLHLLGGA